MVKSRFPGIKRKILFLDFNLKFKKSFLMQERFLHCYYLNHYFLNLRFRLAHTIKRLKPPRLTIPAIAIKMYHNGVIGSVTTSFKPATGFSSVLIPRLTSLLSVLKSN